MEIICSLREQIISFKISPKFAVIQLAQLNKRIKIIFSSVRGYGKLQKVGEKSGKSQGILRWMISGNPVQVTE